MRRAAIFAAVLLAAAAAAAAVPTRTLELEPKLERKRPLPAIALATALAGRPWTVEVEDARGAADPEVVGAQKDGSTTVYEWRAAEAVGPAVATMLRAVLGGSAAAGSAGGGDVVRVSLTKFQIDEISQTFGSSYQAEVGMRVAIESGGARVWAGSVSGAARRSGPDGRASICNRVLTQALAHALADVPVPFPAEAEMVRPAPPASPAPPPPAAAPAPPRGPPPPPGTTPPDKLFADLRRLKAAGLSDETLMSYVKEHPTSTPLSADDVLRWKAAGFSEAVIRAALTPR